MDICTVDLQWFSLTYFFMQLKVETWDISSSLVPGKEQHTAQWACWELRWDRCGLGRRRSGAPMWLCSMVTEP